MSITKKLQYKFLYHLYIVFNGIFMLVPKPVSKKILEIFAFLVYKLNSHYRKIAISNLKLVFNNSKSEQELQKIALNSYKSLAFNIFELLENQNLPKDEILKKMSVVGGEFIANALNSGRKIIFVTAHYGGWELTLPGIALAFDMKVGVVNKKMQNPYIQEIYAAARAKNNITMIEKHSAAKGMLQTLNKGNQVAIVIDQHTDAGCEIEFLGKKVIATDAVARLAIKLDALIVPILTTKSKFRKHEVTVFEPIDVRQILDEDKIFTLTKLQNDIISAQILKNPDLWLWQHKRFKAFYNEIYE
ncbi:MULTISPECIES: lipid A biosynthesis lauroyl acyltransferase [unclassified Campylobacter]|uniref:LpxL/LpxP family acyltransferase n=1 Tax=unclassified Campylobacter TaxID=2593542 RepID=UPI003D347AD2